MKSNEYDMLLNYIKNGIVLSDGTIKDFDIVDYYNIYFENICKVYNNENLTTGKPLLKSFIVKNLGTDALRPLNNEHKFVAKHQVNDLLSTDIILFAQFDENNNVIEGTGYKVTEEDKVEAYDYLMNKHGIVYAKSLMAIFRRIASGYTYETDIDKNKTNKRCK